MRNKLFGPSVALLMLAFFCVASSSEAMERPPIMSEQLYAVRNGESPTPDKLWSRALLELNIPGYAPREDDSYSQRCNYSNALSTLRKIRQERGNGTNYQVVWAQNQDRVFSACDKRSANPTPPLEPKGKRFPARAQSDFLYQLGSWNFYKGKYEDALPSYVRVEKNRRAPQRPNAAYMVVRTLANLQQFDEAYAKISVILADRSLQEVHANTGNYRFVIMSNSNYLSGFGESVISPELAQQHLRWLHGLIRIDPEKTADNRQAVADYNDAKEQLAMYFPLYDKDSRAVDWWLTESLPDSPQDTPRMNAVKRLAPELKLIDWMQASWAYNIFNADWLWALHDPENAYWTQNRRIVAHAWGRWRTEHDGVWLDIAMRRVHPRDPLASDILSAAQPWLIQPWDVKALEQETAEYRAWLHSILENAIRINLGAGDAQKAIDLIASQPNAKFLLNNRDRLYFSNLAPPGSGLENAIRWLVYTGDIEHARLALEAINKHYPHGFKKWTSVLATNLEQAHSVGKTSSGAYGGSDAIANDTSVWNAMLDDLSSDALYTMALDTGIAHPLRALLSRTVLTRALLLGAEADVVDRYAALAAKLNPYLRELILTGVATHDKSSYITFLLKMPRFRPMPLLAYASEIDGATGDLKKEALGIEAIDRYNHNDNNWWCRFDSKSVQDRVFNLAKITPVAGRLFDSSKLAVEVQPYLEMQRAFLSRHPYRQLANAREVEALEAIPSGPKYLSEAVIAREHEQEVSDPHQRNARAADLHRAVRTTRYGCNRNKTYEAYSWETFELLHKRYKDTPWAKATPYWFN
ncbi:MAG: hypothetical protein RL710_1886 [Pseudomonadota bacterium]